MTDVEDRTKHRAERAIERRWDRISYCMLLTSCLCRPHSPEGASTTVGESHSAACCDRLRLLGGGWVCVDDGVSGVHRVAGGEWLTVLVGQVRHGAGRRAAALLERVRHADLHARTTNFWLCRRPRTAQHQPPLRLLLPPGERGESIRSAVRNPDSELSENSSKITGFIPGDGLRKPG